MIRELLRRLNPVRPLVHAIRTLRNMRKRRHAIEWVTFTLSGRLSALPDSRSWFQRRIFGEPALSLWDLDRHFRLIAGDPRPRGVILFLRDPELSLADAQTLRRLIEVLRAAGKTVIAYSQSCDLGSYLIASACSRVILQPGGDLAALGLYQQAVFLKDSLAQIGVQLDVIAITPYKGAFDQLSRSTISPEGQEQIDWLLDSRYTMIVNAIAESRHVTPAAVRAMIDSAPHLDQAALSAGWVDALLYEEGLPAYLRELHPPAPVSQKPKRRLWRKTVDVSGVGRELSILEWEKARGRLIRKETPRPSDDRYIAILPIKGMMLPGESGAPPLPIPLPIPLIDEERAGDLTVVQEVRALIEDDRAAAVIVFIDSGGGAAIAAEAMASALTELAKTRPVIAYMNGVAASGGYMVACPARYIVAQPGTITGSIGVVTAKPVTSGLEAKLLVRSVPFLRGANADLYSPSRPFSESQRAAVRASVEHLYTSFIDRVAKARRMTPEAVDAVGGGRVWTGEQALERGLVDQLGGLDVAIRKARELASLDEHAPAEFFTSHAKSWLPPIQTLDPAAGIRHAITNARLLFNGRAQLILPFVLRREL